jgi:hypothetical protein
MISRATRAKIRTSRSFKRKMPKKKQKRRLKRRRKNKKRSTTRTNHISNLKQHSISQRLNKYRARTCRKNPESH